MPDVASLRKKSSKFGLILGISSHRFCGWTPEVFLEPLTVEFSSGIVWTVLIIHRFRMWSQTKSECLFTEDVASERAAYCQTAILMGNISDKHFTVKHNTWWFIPLSKWVITPVISGLTPLIPFITRVVTHLLSGMSHQVYGECMIGMHGKWGEYSDYDYDTIDTWYNSPVDLGVPFFGSKIHTFSAQHHVSSWWASHNFIISTVIYVHLWFTYWLSRFVIKDNHVYIYIYVYMYI